MYLRELGPLEDSLFFLSSHSLNGAAHDGPDPPRQVALQDYIILLLSSCRIIVTGNYHAFELDAAHQLIDPDSVNLKLRKNIGVIQRRGGAA